MKNRFLAFLLAITLVVANVPCAFADEAQRASDGSAVPVQADDAPGSDAAEPDAGNTVDAEPEALADGISALGDAEADAAVREPVQPDPPENQDDPMASQAEKESSLALDEAIVQAVPGVDYVEGEVIVVFAENKTPEAASDLLAEENLSLAEELFPEEEQGMSAVVAEIENDKTVAEAVAELEAQDEVLLAQPNYIYTLQEANEVVPNDPFVSTAYPAESNAWQLASINAYKAWYMSRSDQAAQTVKVAVIDSGINPDHLDLMNNISIEDAYNSYIDMAGIAAVRDRQSHGTHVAGIIAAQANNGIGTAGVSYNAKIVPIKATDDAGGGTTGTYAKGINKCLTIDGVKVINLSAGTTDADSALRLACEQAVAQGITVVCAAGNYTNCQNITLYPAAYDCTVSVANLQRNAAGVESRYSTSCYNSGVDVSAPGTDIWSTSFTDASGYTSKTGTSMASPVVSGVAALMYAANPALSPAQVKSALCTTAIDMGDPGRDDKYGWGKVDAAAAVKAASLVSLDAVTVSSVADQIYSGQALYPAVTLSYKGEALVEGSDYSIRYENNISAGTARIVLTGIRLYSGERTIRFAINACPIGSSDVTVSGIESGYTYTGSKIVPVPLVKHDGKILSKDVDYTLAYANNIAAGTATITIIGKGNFVGVRTAKFSITKVPVPKLSYKAHVATIGWQPAVSGGTMAGTTGRGLAIEAIRIALAGQKYSGNIRYSAHVAHVGWQDWKHEDTTAGTTGQSRQMEAIQIELTGDLPKYYDIYYRAHCANFGWLGWAKNGQPAGTAGYAYSLQALEVIIVEKGSRPPGNTANAFRQKNSTTVLSYQAHVAKVGWQPAVSDGIMAGTTGRGLAMEAIKVSLPEQKYSGAIHYKAHLANVGWQGWRSNGVLAGTAGQSRQMEAIQIKLTGELSRNYDIYYRVHCENIGWLGWAKNGRSAGTTGYGYSMQALEIKLVVKGDPPPSSSGSDTTIPFRRK